MLLFNPKELSTEDLNLYFGETLVRVHKKGEKPQWLFYHQAVGQTIHLLNSKNMRVELSKDSCFLEQVFPTGYFNITSSALFGQRTGARNVQKGISRQNYSLISMEKFLLQKPLISDVTASNTLLLAKLALKAKVTYCPVLFEKIFENPEYPSLEEATLFLRQRKAFAKALSQDFALVLHPHRKKDFLLFHHQKLVGELISKNKLRLMAQELFLECEQFFEKQGVKLV